MSKVVIFDFDGTIADTFSIIVEIVNSLSEEYGFERLGIEEIAAMRQLRAQDILKVFKMPLWRIPSFLLRVKERLGGEIRHVMPFEGIVDSLEELRRQGYRLGILTSNNLTIVDAFLEQNSITVFDFVYNEKDLFGKGRVLKNLMKQYSLPNRDVVYVGDETRDIDAAHSARLKIISVSWGFNTIRALEQQRPDMLIDKPLELVDAVKRVFSK